MMYLFLIFSLPLMAQNFSQKKMKELPNPQKLEDFDHQNKGCPENSECDPTMGMMLSRWKTLLENLAKDPKNSVKTPQAIELFREKYGLPVAFYTYQKSQLGFKPLLYNSPCKEHNTKLEEKTLRGLAFLKNLSATNATVMRADAIIEVPTSESLIVGQPVSIMDGPNPTRFSLPLEDQPLFIKDKELVVLREDEDVFYALKISSTGSWKVVPLDLASLSQWEEKRENVSCPQMTLDKKSSQPKEFNFEFCKTIWDDDQKKTVIVKMSQGCAS